jgi:hypothetical protein
LNPASAFSFSSANFFSPYVSTCGSVVFLTGAGLGLATSTIGLAGVSSTYGTYSSSSSSLATAG